MTPAQLIARKRDGDELSDDEIIGLIDRYAHGDLPDYQMAAFAMAIYFQGMNARETVSLTRALLHSGTTLQWPAGTHRVDKHSTGGIGDKVSLVLAPLLASCGLKVPMLSGRGLGITGGTLDKLESIPGFRTDLSTKELQSIVDRVGCVITGASEELAPADRKLYALRDVTGTVPSRPLIVSSIMSKKLAENLDSLVLDVKCGSGAFMKSLPDAQALAMALVEVGEGMGVRTSALISDMNQPLGRAVGNALEVREAIQVLRGEGPHDVTELSIQLGVELLASGDVSGEEARKTLDNHLRNGMALEKFAQMVQAQDGHLDNRFDFGCDVAPTFVVSADSQGRIGSIDNAAIGNMVVSMGGGRKTITDSIDHAVGMEVLVRVGDSVQRNQPLAIVHAREEPDPETLRAVFEIVDAPTEPSSLVYERIAAT